MAISAKSIVDIAMSQLGRKYKFGAEITDLSDMTQPVDCSELVEAVYREAARRWELGTGKTLRETCPDGARYQWQWVKNHQLERPIMECLHTPAAIVFLANLRGVVCHVGLVARSMMIVEAVGGEIREVTLTRRQPTSAWALKGFGGLMPGVDYANAK